MAVFAKQIKNQTENRLVNSRFQLLILVISALLVSFGQATNPYKFKNLPTPVSFLILLKIL